MSEQRDLVNDLTNEIAKRLLEYAQTVDDTLTPEELLGQFIVPIVGNIVRVAGDMLLAEGRPRTQCRIQLKVDDKKIEMSHGWTEDGAVSHLAIESEQVTLQDAVLMMRDTIERAVHGCLDTLPKSYHRLGLVLTGLEQVMAKLLLSSGDVTVRDKLDAVTELSSSLQRALLLDGHPNLLPRTRH